MSSGVPPGREIMEGETGTEVPVYFQLSLRDKG